MAVSTIADDKKKALNLAIAQIEKSCGKGSIMRMDAKEKVRVEAVNWRKQRELSRSARVWVDRHGRRDDAYRFDVIGVLVAGSRVRIRHVPNAFPLHLSA